MLPTPMNENRIKKAFAELQSKTRKGFIPFITAGDPDLETTKSLLLSLSNLDSTVIELGVPFSDPMADGVVIQKSSERALRNKFGVAEILEIVAQVRTQTETPIILFSYFNPLLQYGLENLCRDAKKAGIDGILVTDLIPEEAEEFSQMLRANHLDMIFLTAPTSTDERIKMIAEKATGFIYAVSRTGVTGQQEKLSERAEKLVQRIKKFSNLPVAVGFGISNANQIAEVWKYADAAVVGSAIVQKIEESINLGIADKSGIIKRVEEFVRQLLPAA
ncbi:MAG: tryptophan synthase subunit alpha [Acidobacteria bacterium]|nr:MAG: tryptophan synthase subunit alpha [Acidobacteriota bacterium]